ELCTFSPERLPLGRPPGHCFRRRTRRGTATGSAEPTVPGTGRMPVALEPVPSIPSLVVVSHHDPATADSLRHAVESIPGWQVLVAAPNVPGPTPALAAGPSVTLVGCAVLANLPADCSTPLIAVGDDDRPADVSAAMSAGARSLLAWPDGAANLP